MGSGAGVRSLLALWDSWADLHPDRPAVVDDDRELTYAALAGSAAATAAALVDRGLSPGDRVALTAPNSVSWVVAAFAVLRAGAVLAPLSHRAPAEEHRAALAAVAPALVITDNAGDLTWGDPSPGGRVLDLSTAIVWSDVQAPAPRVARDQVALLLATSGTTGRPHDVAMTHEQLVRLYTDVSSELGVTADDRSLCVVPLAHSFGFNGVLLIALAAGASVRLLPDYDPARVARLLSDEPITIVTGPPTVLLDLAKEHATGTVRLAITGGTDVPTGTVRAACRALGIGEISVGYGLTETCGTVAIGRLPLADGDDRPLMTPMDGVEVRIVDPDGGLVPSGGSGRVQVRGYNVVTSDGGWLDTGDSGCLDGAGRLSIEGRTKDTVIVSGFNVSPREVEEALLEHPSVRGVGVIGVPDARQGEQLVAFVVPHPGGDISDDELVALGKSRLAAYKVPRRFVVLDELPTTTNGKLSRARLRALAEGHSEPVR